MRRLAFLLLFLCLCGPASAHYANDADAAACLDPDAYRMYTGSSLPVTVPEGETWYSHNLWWVRIGGATVFQRRNEPVALPAGTQIESDSYTNGFAYICQPSLVLATADEYRERLARLATLPIQAVEARPSGTWATAPIAGDKIMVVLASSHDVAWTILCGPAGCINTLSEISDSHPMRFAEPVLIPIKTSMFNEIMVRRSESSTANPGIGAILYKQLPADW